MNGLAWVRSLRIGLGALGAFVFMAARAGSSVIAPGAPLPVAQVLVEFGVGQDIQPRMAIGAIPGADVPFAFSWEFGGTASGTVRIDPAGALQLIDFTITNPSTRQGSFLLDVSTGQTVFEVTSNQLIATASLDGTFAKPNRPVPPPFPEPFPPPPSLEAPSFEASAAGMFVAGGVLIGNADTTLSGRGSRLIDLGNGPLGVPMRERFLTGISAMNSFTIPLTEVRIMPIPEPSSVQLLLAGLAAVAAARLNRSARSRGAARSTVRKVWD